MDVFKQKTFVGERACFGAKNVTFQDCIFQDGESHLKESSDIVVNGGFFRWKYPLWYSKNVKVENCSWMEGARAGVWYTKDITVKNCIIQAPKNFRRCENLTLENVFIPKAQETLWTCNGVKLKNVEATGDYFAMNCQNMEVDSFSLSGNYSFDGAKNVVIRSSRLLTKDAFWNSENVTVYDSYISGEYLGWNSKNLTLINCTVDSLQGFCYCENLTLKDCKLLDTTFAFEYSDVNATVTTSIDSVFNPQKGYLKASSIKELIIEKDIIDPTKTLIECDDIQKISDKPEWK